MKHKMAGDGWAAALAMVRRYRLRRLEDSHTRDDVGHQTAGVLRGIDEVVELLVKNMPRTSLDNMDQNGLAAMAMERADQWATNLANGMDILASADLDELERILKAARVKA